jgi:uncharacterized protein
MKKSVKLHQYEIIFQGGKIVYQPLDGRIIDLIKKRTIDLPAKRKISLHINTNKKRDPAVSEFRPVCLTIYASHQCNLNCTYCYIPDKELYPIRFIEPTMVEAGAQFVAKNCKERNLPFILGFHGGNEPLLHPGKIESFIQICKTIARTNNLEFLSFCTTNGVIPESTAKWAAERFHGISLSWDGPSELHDAYRKDKLKVNTSLHVERSAGIFTELMRSPKMLKTRCTITSSSVERMEELTSYFGKARFKSIEFYPVFENNDRQLPQELIPDPGKFVYYFLKAKSFGDAHGIRVSFSGSRITDYHGRYCMVLQDNLTITPDGYLTNCFYHTQNYKKQYNPFFYGKCLTDKIQLHIESMKLYQTFKVAVSRLTECLDCFNRYHCSQGCPSVCPFEKNYHESVIPGCTKEKWLGLAAILEFAGYLKPFGDESAFFDFFSNISYTRIS